MKLRDIEIPWILTHRPYSCLFYSNSFSKTTENSKQSVEREKGRDLTQSYDDTPIQSENESQHEVTLDNTGMCCMLQY